MNPHRHAPIAGLARLAWCAALGKIAKHSPQSRRSGIIWAFLLGLFLAPALSPCLSAGDPSPFPFTIGDLPPGKSITVTYEVSVSNPGGDLNPVFPAESVASRGAVRGTNFSTVFTDDPDSAAAGDPTVTPVPINDPPVVSVPGTQNTAKQTPVNIADVTVADVEATELTVTLSVDPLKGKLLVDDSVPAGVPADSISGNNSHSVALAGTLLQLNNTFGAASGIQYTGNLNFVGSDTLAVNADDLGSSGFNNPPFNSISPIPINVTGSNYDTWRNANFDLADLIIPGLEATVWGDGANPDFDLFPNIFDFLYGFDPNTFDGTDPLILGTRKIGPDLFATYTFRKRINLSGASLHVDVSGQPASGFSPTSKSPSSTPIDAAFEEVTYEDDTPIIPGNARFGRIRMSRD